MKYLFALVTIFSLFHNSARGAQETAALKFKKETIEVGTKKIRVEIADDEAKREQGLMFRKELKEGEGMLFVFDDSQIRTFWMKNTLIPLSIGYFDPQKKLIDIQEMVPASLIEREPKLYPSKGPARYALEAPPGWFKRNRIAIGATFIWPRH